MFLTLTGCASITYGDKEIEKQLKALQPIPGKTSLYVCREVSFGGAGNSTTPVVDGVPLGALKPNSFTHATVEPGSHNVHIKTSLGGTSGTLNLTTQAGEVAYIWIGVTGHGWGTLTLDHFSNKNEAEQCVRGAQYAVQHVR